MESITFNIYLFITAFFGFKTINDYNFLNIINIFLSALKLLFIANSNNILINQRSFYKNHFLHNKRNKFGKFFSFLQSNAEKEDEIRQIIKNFEN